MEIPQTLRVLELIRTDDLRARCSVNHVLIKKVSGGVQMNQQFLDAFFGGMMIGAASALMLWLNGRIAGNSGIIAQALNFKDGAWRLCYLMGLLAGAFFFQAISPQKITLTFSPSVARLSKRSIVATAVFMAGGIVTVLIIRQTGGVWWLNSF